MLKNVLTMLMFTFVSFNIADAQNTNTDVSNTTLAYIQKNYPKLSEVMKNIEKDSTPIEIINTMRGPARTGKGKIQLNYSFFNAPRPDFPEDRLIIVVLHEQGHVLYSRKLSAANIKPERNFESKVSHEYEAFKYSLEQAVDYAKAGNKGPLQQVLKNLKQRSEAGKNNTKDPHIPAINKLMKEDLWQKAESLI